jgi:dTMP kinase
MKGLFITFEGGEGAGKSTQVKRLQTRLESAGYRVVATREPGGTPRAEAIRAAILAGEAKPYGSFAEALMFYSARHDHLEKKIRPALAAGAIVVCDRFSDSTRAYQGAVGEADPGSLAALERAVVGSTRPDLTLILDIPAEKGLARAASRRGEGGGAVDRFEGENLNFHKNLREFFKSIATAEPERCRLIGADREPDEVEREIWAAVTARLAPPAREAERTLAAGEG